MPRDRTPQPPHARARPTAAEEVCTRRGVLKTLATSVIVAWAGGCRPASNQVVVYAALDREFSEPVLNAFTRQTGIAVRAKYDDESTKSVGLASLIVQEAARPRCDLFWNNEVIHTVRLAARGLLAAYDTPQAAAFPPQFRSPLGLWYGFAARARVLIVNRRLVPDEDRPTSIFDLCDPRWKGRVGIARPVAGTTATQVAAWFATLGAEHAKQFLRALKANQVQILGGNRQVAQACAAGQIAVGLTDTDDALIAQQQGAPVALVYPDRQADQLGTLFIPNTLAIIRSAPHQRQAEELLDYLLSPPAEAMLAQCASRQIPLRKGAAAHPDVETPATVHPMAVDFEAAAAQWDAAARFVAEEFLGSA